MKKYITLAILTIAIVSCSGDTDGISVETLLESGTV